MMKIGIFAKTFQGNEPTSILREIRRTGYSCTQYNMVCSGLESMPRNLEEHFVRAVAKESSKFEISISAVSGTYNMIHPDINKRQQGHKRLRTLASKCSFMGTNLITICTGTRDPCDQWKKHSENSMPDAWADLTASLEIAIGIAEENNVFIGIEPEAANVVENAVSAKKILNEMKSDRLKIVFDPANLIEETVPEKQHDVISSSLELLAADIIICHAKDKKINGKVTAAGQGILDYEFFVSELKRLNLNVPLIAHGLPASEAIRVSSFLKNLLGSAS